MLPNYKDKDKNGKSATYKERDKDDKHDTSDVNTDKEKDGEVDMVFQMMMTKMRPETAKQSARL